jgi:hypothetical protein
MVPRLTLGQLWLGLAIVLPGLASLLAGVSTVDLAWQLRAGEAILSGDGIPRVDTYTFTVAGQSWLDQQWGAQAVLALTYRLAGWTGLVLLRALLISAAWACLVLAIRLTAPRLPVRTVAGLALSAFVVSAPALALRPQLFGVLLLCGTLALLAGRRVEPRLPFAIPLIAAAWANVHGSFLFAPILVGLAWLDDLVTAPDQARRMRLIVLATALATLVNPFGPWVIAYVVGLSANRELSARVSEWQPPSIADPTGLLFFISLAAVALALAARRRLPPAPVALTLLVFAGLGLATARGVAWWPAVAAVTMAGVFRPEDPVAGQLPLRPRPIPATVANTAILVALLLTGIILLPAWRAPDPDLGLGAPRGLLAQAPPGVTRELRKIARPDDRIWNSQPLGSWLELAIPTVPVAFDSRIELFPSALWADHDVVAGGRPGWEAVLNRWGATIVVTGRDGLPVRVALGNSLAWREAYVDGDGAIFVRADRDRRLAALPVEPTPAIPGLGSARGVPSPILWRG